MRKLDLACGASKAEGFEGADIASLPGVDHVFDIFQFPWPFADASFDEVRSSHFIEHIPHAFYTPNPRFAIGQNLTAMAEGPHSVELFLKFFDECFRILKPGGSLHVLCPHGHSDRIFQDPTHRRVIVHATFDYLDRDWRKANGLEHAAYGVSCHFPAAQRQMRASNTPAQTQALQLMADYVQDAAVNRYWNMISDFDVLLKKAAVLAPAPEVATATA